MSALTQAPVNEANGTSAHHQVERLTTAEVMSLARISRATLWRRVSAGRLPYPVDRGRQALFLRIEVVAALRAQTTKPCSVSVAIEQRLDVLRRRRRGAPLDSVKFPE